MWDMKCHTISYPLVCFISGGLRLSRPCLRTYNQADMIVGCPANGPFSKDFLFFG